MRPLSLRLKGLTRYREPLELDLSTIPPGLVAIVGGNGEGKTTLMDALGPVPLYRRFSTRPGALKDGCGDRDTQVDLSLAYRGRTYRLLVNVDPQAAGGAGKQEAYLFEDGVPMTQNGRVSDYDEAIAAVFPPREVFLASAFGAQSKAGSFLSLDMKGRKDLFAELLGLGHLQTLAERSAAGRRPLDAIAADLERDAARLLEDEASAVHLRAEAGLFANALREALVNEGALEQMHLEALTRAQAAAALLDQLAEACRQAEARVSGLERTAAAAWAEASDLTRSITASESTAAGETEARERAGLLAAAVADQRSAESEWRTAHQRVVTAERSVADLGSSIARARSDIDRASATIAASATARSNIASLRDQIARFAGVRDRITALDRAIREAEPLVRMRLRDADAEVGAGDIIIRETAIAIAAAEAAEKLIGGVPCGGKVMRRADERTIPFGSEQEDIDCGTCLFLSSAQAGAATLPALRAKQDAARTRKAEGEEKRQLARDENELLDKQRSELAQAQRESVELARLEADLARNEALATGANAAETARAEATRRADALAADLAACETEAAAARSAEADTITRGATLAARARELTGADVRLRELEAALARLPLLRDQKAAAEQRAFMAERERDQVVVPPPPEAQRSVSEAAAEEVNEAAERLAVARAASRSAGDAAQHAKGRLAQLGDLSARSAALATRRDGVARRRSGFVLLEAALGRNGIQALEIDAAGPEVSTLCNELLEACFGSRFTLSLRTIQEAEKGRVQKEVFDLAIHDGLRGGGPRTHDWLSGGEQVLVNEALRLALSIFNARRHGAMFETLFRDEADTGLSENLRPLFPLMLRKAMELGGFRNLYFITHAREAWEQADTIIRVEDGRATIEVL